jgi:outer membrane protein TolC
VKDLAQLLNKLMRRVITSLLCCLTAFTFAQDNPALFDTEKLSAKKVLQSAARHYPKILENIAEFRAAEARTLSAKGAFDLTLDVDSYNFAEGFYDGTSMQATASRYLNSRGGARVYGGYKVSNGSFPVYEDERFTNTGGQLNLGVLFSLLRDRDIDPRRFKVSDAGLAAQQAKFDVLLTKLGIAQKTMISYWRWVALGQKKHVYGNLLAIAQKRESGLIKEVKEGARAKIVLTESLQNITQRKSLLAKAERDFAIAANQLSMFYRDDTGSPVIVSEKNLPEYKPEPNASDKNYQLQNLNTLYASRPELKKLRNSITRAMRRIQLNENSMLPRLDLNLGVYQPLGSIAEGGSSHNESDVIIGLQFSVPLERRAARGAMAETQARLDALRQKERLMQDQIQLEVRNILLNLKTAEELLMLAGNEVNQAGILRDAEIQRFRRGASDFFLVNIRENTAAEAEVRFFLAGLQREIAQVNFDAATANLEKLGISEAILDY